MTRRLREGLRCRWAFLAAVAWMALSVSSRPAWSREAAVADPSPKINVAVYVGEGTSRSKANLLKILEGEPEIEVHQFTADDIRAGKLEGCQVLIHPGGSGSGQARALEDEGREAVRRFVNSGGGYLGICAGAYLATCHYSWSLNILQANVADSKHWARGYGPVEIGLSPAGREFLGVEEPTVTIYYHQGPLLVPGKNAKPEAYEAWAVFEGDIARNGAPEGVMPGTTAIAAGRHGEGRVVCFSPHPERTEGLEFFVLRAVDWLTLREVVPR